MNRFNKFIKYNISRVISSLPVSHDPLPIYKTQLDYLGKVKLPNFFSKNQSQLINIHLNNSIENIKEKNFTKNNYDSVIQNNSYLKYTLTKLTIDKLIQNINDIPFHFHMDNIFVSSDPNIINKHISENYNPEYLTCIIRFDNNSSNNILVISNDTQNLDLDTDFEIQSIDENNKDNNKDNYKDNTNKIHSKFILLTYIPESYYQVLKCKEKNNSDNMSIYYNSYDPESLTLADIKKN